MKYQKGSFITVPNRHVLEGQSAIVQATFMWICSYANEDGNCYPSRTTLAKNVNCSVDSIDNAIKTLCSLNILEKMGRSEGGNQLTNVYQIRLVADMVGGGSRYIRPPLADIVGPELNPVLTKSKELSFSESKDSQTTPKIEIVKIPTKSAYAELKGYDTSQVIPLREWAEHMMGHRFPNSGKQQKHISQMLAVGFLPEKIREKWEEMMDDDFWGSKGFDFGNVASEIGKSPKKKFTIKRYG